MPSPIGHSTGFNYGVRMALYNGQRLVLQDRWSGAEAADLVEAERCTYTLAATTFLHDFVAACDHKPRDVSCMRLFGCGGAPVPPDLVRRALGHGITVLRLYGSTEVLVATWNRPDSPLDKRLDTDGLAVDDVEVITRNGANLEVRNAPGEVYTRGPDTCVGFFDDPERTAATFDDQGWVKSGDLAVIDDDGYLTVVGRMKEILIRGGLNVAPREVEEVILKLPQVNSVAVIGLPDERLGEIGCACVVLEPSGMLTFEELTDHLRSSGLATYKWPERLELVPELPMTPSGKVRKHILVATLTHQ
jgi:acyl-CoA synthetase (AMP-forming)/AMP-acid ligase II